MAQKQEAKTVRLRNINSGAVVFVAEEKANRMGSEWEAVKATARAKSDDK